MRGRHHARHRTRQGRLRSRPKQLAPLDFARSEVDEDPLALATRPTVVAFFEVRLTKSPGPNAGELGPAALHKRIPDHFG